MITLVDYGINNLRSVEKALERAGAAVTLASTPEAVAAAQKLVLPGVGAFRAGMQALDRLRLIAPLRRAAERGVPLLGICLGMQLLFDESEEMEPTAGLGLIPGRVLRFRGEGLKVPHMGWNQVQPVAASPLLRDVPEGAYAYFVHSYYCAPARTEAVLATADHGGPFAAAVAQANVFGIQFHPEKSQTVGLGILRNFIEHLPRH